MCMADTLNEIDISALAIWTKVPHVKQGTDDFNTKQTQTLAMICEHYPPEDWTNVYTDGYTYCHSEQCGWDCHLLEEYQCCISR